MLLTCGCFLWNLFHANPKLSKQILEKMGNWCYRLMVNSRTCDNAMDSSIGKGGCIRFDGGRKTTFLEAPIGSENF